LNKSGSAAILEGASNQERAEPLHIVERARAFVQSLRELAGRSAWDWRRCPRCGETLTYRNGSYTRHPWCFEGRRAVRVQRHRCHRCRRTYSERSARLVRGSWYAREVHRCAVDHWQHVGSSARRTAELLRSWLGRQERWQLWRPVDAPPAGPARCYLSASTVARWLDRAGRAAERTVAGQLAGVPGSGQVATDGLWARLRGGATRVVLLLVDGASGVLWPPVVVAHEATAPPWAQLFARATPAGLALETLCGVTSDGARGVGAYLNQALEWVNHQRCVFHLWRGRGGELAAAARAAASGLSGAAAEAARRQARRELVGLLRGVLDAASEADARAALATLAAHPLESGLARAVAEHLEAALVHLKRYNRGLVRVAPEWCWRDFRLRLSHGRNHGSDERLERAALVWAIYRNFEPAQERYERKRRYRHPGQSPLAVAGAPPGACSYLDALAV
jgi:hypothetical protein